MKHFGAVAIFIAVLFPVLAQAETVLRIGEDISVSDTQVVDGDYYVAVGPLGDTTMSGSVAQDMYAFGGVVNVNGSVGGDLTIVGGTSQLHATVTDDVRIISGDVTLGDYVGGDLFVMGGLLTVLSSATIDGDVFFFGGEADISGTIKGSVMGTSEKIRIDATVGKNVDVKTASTLTLGDRAVVAGNVTYESPEMLVRAANASVEGDVTHTPYKEKPVQKDVEDFALPFFMSLFAALTLFLLFRKQLGVLVQNVYVRPLQSSLFGLGFVILGPIAALLLMATMLGFYVGLALLGLALLIMTLGYALCGVVLGAWLSKLLTKKLQVSLVWIIIGTAIIHAALLIPIVGGVVVLATCVLTIGGIAYGAYKLVA